MTRHKLSSFAAILFTFVSSMNAQQSPAERVAEIQAALRAAKLDGWLFYDFRHSDPLAYRILKLDEKMLASRRWFYYVPASGESVKIVQSIEHFKRGCEKRWARERRNRRNASRCSIRP